ncbi:MAG: S1 RNA-binding domain-containing protein [Nanoarchaeota archaeon]|nr:S1 RNA-binding domain-containing protein [Nanoarchaeota archaeon]
MFYKKKGLPEEGEVVVCTVNKILFHSIFADLDEFETKEGMIHISEIAPGRIRNIRDYVKEDKKLVCIVLSINKEKGHVDLSLRRVPMSLRNKKMEEFKQEIKSEKLLEYIGKDLKKDLKTMYSKFGYKLIEEYGLLGAAFNEISIHGMEAIEDLKFPDKEAKVLIDIIQDKIKPHEISVHTFLNLHTLEEDGVEDIKESLLAGEKFATKTGYKIKMSYISAPKYKVELFSNDYKKGEQELEEVFQIILKEANKRKVNIERINKK